MLLSRKASDDEGDDQEVGNEGAPPILFHQVNKSDCQKCEVSNLKRNLLSYLYYNKVFVCKVCANQQLMRALLLSYMHFVLNLECGLVLFSS